ncbi:MAG: PEGA domain-containing protein, partial [Verrucomicrobia bacterium]|nr:PEGA domain-containing protein [Verrucomicrobiota bacterium]
MDQGDWFYVMEFIDGENVEACVRRKGPLEPTEALNITLQVARALAAAEKQHLVHRDLKPSNLMLVEQDEERLVKVIDFGLAKKAKEEGEDTAALTVGGFVGTPLFASPEQVEEVDLDVRSDIYSLGATLFFMLSGKAPFTGSVGQVMSQHLYKPIDLQPLSHLPPAVLSLLGSMLEKDRERRPQTPRELQNAIVRCLEEIRGTSTQSPVTTAVSATDTLSQETLFAHFRVMEELRDSPHARHLIAEDLRRERLVNLYILKRGFLGDPQWLAAFRRAVSNVQNHPHALLRTIYSLETTGEFGFLIEEYVNGPSLLDLLRARSVLSASEVALLLRTLAPLAEHIGAFRLEEVDLSLSGVQLVKAGPSNSEFQSDLLRRPLTTWQPFELKVNPLDWSFAPFSAGTITADDSASQSIVGIVLRSSPVRSLSLLAYELLGAQRESAELRRPYKPVAALTEEGNAVLRRGLADEYSSATRLATELAAAVEAPAVLPEPQEVAALLIQVEPPGATILLDGDPPQVPPRTFTHVSFGPHQLVASLTGYETVTRSLQVSRGMSPEIFVGLRKVTKIVHLSIKTDPAGALVLLDGTPPQIAPDTFTDVNFGTHRLEATLPNYHPIKKDLQVQKGTPPELNLKLKPIKKISLMGKLLRLAALLTILVCLGLGGAWIYRKYNEIDVLSIRSSPPGAAILLDGKPAEQPANTFKEVPFGIHELTATLDGYEPVKREINLDRGIKEIQLELKKVPELAAMTVATNPPNASILLDGKPPSSANIFSHVPFGKHVLTAKANGFLPFKQEIQVNAESPSEIRLTLTEIPEIAALTVQTDPPGASILLDGKAPQKPNTFSHVPFGKHQLTVTLDNYESVRQEIDVSRGMTPEIQLKLKEIKEVPALSVSSDPPGASILLDGKSPQNSNTFTHVSFGKHRLTAALDKYEPLQQEIDVSRGMTPEIRLKLKEIQEIPALSVSSDPPGASILLDGKPPQNPNTFTHVSFGVHRLTATLENYEPVTQDIEITAGSKPEVQLKLKKTDPLVALLSESKKYSEGSPEQVEAYVHLAQYLQKSGAADSEQYLKELGEIVQRLRTRVPPIAKDQFIFSYKQSIQEAANLNVIPAIVWLAEQERGQAAYDLYLRAANLGDSYAMSIVGRLHLYKGTSSDDEEAFAWLKRAYEAANPNLEAGAYLAFCYLNGRGTKKDVEQGKKLTLELANQNVVFAMTQAGVVLATEAQGKRDEAASSSNPRNRKQLSADADDLDLQARHWWER